MGALAHTGMWSVTAIYAPQCFDFCQVTAHLTHVLYELITGFIVYQQCYAEYKDHLPTFDGNHLVDIENHSHGSHDLLLLAKFKVNHINHIENQILPKESYQNEFYGELQQRKNN